MTRKITDGVAKFKLGKLDCLELGNLDAKRDWGHAEDYVEGMWRMLQSDKPDTYVLATNHTFSVRDFMLMTFNAAGIDIRLSGNGEKETAINVANGKVVARVNPRFYRPAEVDLLVGDYSKAKVKLGWEPKTAVKEICDSMLNADIKRNQQGFSF